MNLDQVSIEIRPRRAWEAVDLGLLMARRWWWPMTKVWVLLTLPLFLLLNLLPQEWLWVSFVVIWWLKPLFERPLLHILSQAVFGHLPDTRSTITAFPTQARLQVFLSLTWRRLSFTRAMDLPVIQLEGLRAERRKQRLSILHREDSNPATWLTIIGFHLESFLSIGFLMLLYAFVPSEIEIDWMSLFTSDEALWFVYLLNFSGYLAMALVAPFYVACGFSLYLNRRIKLEAWDIDIAFQRIVNKRRPSQGTLAGLALLIVMIIGGLGQPAEVYAQEDALPIEAATVPATNSDLDRTSAKSKIETILASETFKQKEIWRYPSFLDTDEKDKETDDWDWLLNALKYFTEMLRLASWLELLLWAAVISLIIWVVFRYRHWLAAYLPQSLPDSLTRARPVTLFGLDLSRESLPDDVSHSALGLWQQGEQRAALALLYRACLIRLLDAGLEIEDGHTETECLQLARDYARDKPLAAPAITYFGQLTLMWQHLAYGHIHPDPQEGERLCQAWNGLWRPTTAQAAGDGLHG
jgi:hypothetical protein